MPKHLLRLRIWNESLDKKNLYDFLMKHIQTKRNFEKLWALVFPLSSVIPTRTPEALYQLFAGLVRVAVYQSKEWNDSGRLPRGQYKNRPKWETEELGPFKVVLPERYEVVPGWETRAREDFLEEARNGSGPLFEQFLATYLDLGGSRQDLAGFLANVNIEFLHANPFSILPPELFQHILSFVGPDISFGGTTGKRRARRALNHTLPITLLSGVDKRFYAEVGSYCDHYLRKKVPGGDLDYSTMTGTRVLAVLPDGKPIGKIYYKIFGTFGLRIGKKCIIKHGSFYTFQLGSTCHKTSFANRRDPKGFRGLKESCERLGLKLDTFHAWLIALPDDHPVKLFLQGKLEL